MRRMHKSGIDGMKIGYGWGMYNPGIDERNESGILWRVRKSGIDGMKVVYRLGIGYR